MGKASRKTRGPKLVNVSDAARVIVGLAQFAATPAPRGHSDLAERIAREGLSAWARSPVSLRLDADFTSAMLDSDDDAPISTDWLDRSPFDTFCVTLAEPLSLHDGTDLCHYWGFIALGITSRPVDERRVQTLYGPLAAADGIRALWLYTKDGSSGPEMQTVTTMVRGTTRHGDTTVGQVVRAQQEIARMQGSTWGAELEVISPLTLLLAMYLAASEPDLEWLPPERTARPQQLQNARIGDLGWRIGAAVRDYRREDTSRSAGPALGRPGGWRLPPHIRRAHWRRVRIATRDDSGAVIGNQRGAQDVDWHYETRWIPPTPVNAVDGQVAPAVRPVH